jgi:hypothetical protein
MRVWFAAKCFLRILFDGAFAGRMRQMAEAELAPPQEELLPPAPKRPVAAAPSRSDAIALLAALQREARFVDIVCEPLDGYSDAQVGAAARDVLGDCAKVLDRVFALQRVIEKEEGSQVEVPAGYDAARFRLTGNVSREPPLSGQLMHAGWCATRCELPTWSGSGDAALVVAPAEVQVA